MSREILNLHIEDKALLFFALKNGVLNNNNPYENSYVDKNENLDNNLSSAIGMELCFKLGLPSQEAKKYQDLFDFLNDKKDMEDDVTSTMYNFVDSIYGTEIKPSHYIEPSNKLYRYLNTAEYLLENNPTAYDSFNENQLSKQGMEELGYYKVSFIQIYASKVLESKLVK